MAWFKKKPVKPARKPPVRHVFGRVRVKMENREYWLEQRKDGIYFKPLHGRHWAVISYTHIVDMHIQQFPLPI